MQLLSLRALLALVGLAVFCGAKGVVKELNSEEELHALSSGANAVLIEPYQCGFPCATSKRIWNQVALRFSSISFFSLEVEKSQCALCVELQIQRFPAVVIVSNGKSTVFTGDDFTVAALAMFLEKQTKRAWVILSSLDEVDAWLSGDDSFDAHALLLADVNVAAAEVHNTTFQGVASRYVHDRDGLQRKYSLKDVAHLSEVCFGILTINNKKSRRRFGIKKLPTVVLFPNSGPELKLEDEFSEEFLFHWIRASLLPPVDCLQKAHHEEYTDLGLPVITLFTDYSSPDHYDIYMPLMTAVAKDYLGEFTFVTANGLDKERQGWYGFKGIRSENIMLEHKGWHGVTNPIRYKESKAITEKGLRAFVRHYKRKMQERAEQQREEELLQHNSEESDEGEEPPMTCSMQNQEEGGNMRSPYEASSDAVYDKDVLLEGSEGGGEGGGGGSEEYAHDEL